MNKEKMKNSNRLLLKGRLEKLIRKLEVLPTEKWRKNADSERYEPSLDSVEVGYRTDYVRYETYLKNFGIILKQESCDMSYILRIDYSLQVLNSNGAAHKGKVLDEETESREENGHIAKLFKKIDKKYETYQKQQERKRERDTLTKFKRTFQ